MEKVVFLLQAVERHKNDLAVFLQHKNDLAVFLYVASNRSHNSSQLQSAAVQTKCDFSQVFLYVASRSHNSSQLQSRNSSQHPDEMRFLAELQSRRILDSWIPVRSSRDQTAGTVKSCRNARPKYMENFIFRFSGQTRVVFWSDQAWQENRFFTGKQRSFFFRL